MGVFERIATGAIAVADATVGTRWERDEDQRQARLIAGVVYVMSLPGLLYLVHFVAAGIYWMAASVGLTISTSMFAAFSLRSAKRPVLAGVVTVSAFFVLLATSAYSTGGFYGPNFAWLYVIPVFAALLANMWVGGVFTGLVLLASAGFWAAERSGLYFVNFIEEDARAIRSLADRSGAILLIGVAIAIIANRERHGSKKLTTAYNSLKDELQQRESLHDRMIHTERLASMGKLSAAVAHEINNPMTYVIGNLQELYDGHETDEEERRELIHDALDGANRVSSLVRDMQVYSRTPESLRLASVDIGAAIDTASKMVSNRVRHSARFHVSCVPGLRARASEPQLVQVLVNLLTNAIDAMDGAAENNALSLTAETEGAEVQIVVQDSGTGIPLEVQKKLFEPFFTTKDIGQGTGMGLAISSSLIKAMNGSICFDSVETEGTRFVVTLPAISGEADGELASDDRRRRVLVVDDDKAGRAVERILSADHVVTEADPRRALRRCENESFDLILCNIAMREMTGEQFHAALALSQPKLAQRVFFTTAATNSSEAEVLGSAAERPILHRPLTYEILRDVI